MTVVRSPRFAPRARRTSLTIAASGLALLLAACGSQLDPNEVAVAGGGTVGSGGVVVGADGEVISADGGTTGSVDGSTGGDTGTSGSGSSGSGSSGSGSGSGGGSGDGSSPDGGSDEPIPTGSCDGFKNSTGISNDTITIGNASDISGPVPGLFESAQDAVKAFVAYYNRSNPDGICGRSLALKNYDSRTDASADQRNYVDMCDNVFAAVGSMSAFDSGGAKTAADCGIPDIRSTAVTGARSSCDTCFGAQSTVATQFQNAVPDFLKKTFPEAAQKAAMVYLNAGAAGENGQLQPKAMKARGMKFVYVQGIDTAEFNYAPYVQGLKDNGARHVQFLGGIPQYVRLAQTMQQQGYKPDVYVVDPTAYHPDYLEGAGSAAEGTVAFINFVPFEEAASNAEMQLYLQWLQQTKPGATPDFFGLFAWSAARLFVEQASKLGGKLTRPALVQAMRGVTKWTANGMHSPQEVGPKRTGECWRFVEVKGGKWVPIGGTKYTCAGITEVS